MIVFSAGTLCFDFIGPDVEKSHHCGDFQPRGTSTVNQGHPDHWTSYTSPSRWFQLWHPDSWEAVGAEQVTQLRPPGEEGVLLINSLWIPNAEEIDLASVANFRKEPDEIRNLQQLSPLEISYRSVALSAEVLTKSHDSSSEILEATRAWRRRRLWVAQHRSVVVVALYESHAEADHEWESIAAMILNTLTFAENPVDPPELFAERVLQLAQVKFPLLKCRQTDDFQLELGRSKFNLFNVYRSYVASPERLEEIVLPALTTVVQMLERNEEQHNPPFDEVRDRIMPMLYAEAMWQEKLPNFVAKSWVAGLRVLYVVDEPQAYWYVSNDLLKRWEIDLYQLHERALQNLETHFEKNGMECSLLGEPPGPRILMPTQPDAYNTARMLSESFREQLQEALGSEFALGIPNRDFFIALSLDSEETLSQVQQQITDDFNNKDHPLCEHLLCVTPDGISRK